MAPAHLKYLVVKCMLLIVVVCLVCALITLELGAYLSLGAHVLGTNIHDKDCDFIGNGSLELSKDTMMCKRLYLKEMKKRLDFDSLFYNTSIQQEYEAAVRGTPFQPLKNFDSPCWVSDMNGELTLRCFPAVYLVGFGKSGTTDLFGNLRKHELIFPGKHKESHYWDFRRLAFWNTRVEAESFSDYVDDFKDSSRRILSLNNGDINPSSCPMVPCIFTKRHYKGFTIDGTPSYMHMYGGWENIPANTGRDEPKVTIPMSIQAVNSRTKMIIAIRHPVDRAYSMFRHFVHDEPAEVFHSVMKTSIRLWKGCLDRHTVRACAFNYSLIPCDDLFKCGVYLRASMYPVYLREWLNVFPRQQFFFVKSEDYYTDRKPTIRNILQFLGLPDFNKQMYDIISKREIKNNRERKQYNMEPMMNSTRSMLYKFYAPFVKDLVVLLNDTKYMWDFGD